MEVHKCKCGCAMERTYHHSECVGGDGWNTPYEYEVTEEWTCPECGEVECETYLIQNYGRYYYQERGKPRLVRRAR